MSQLLRSPQNLAHIRGRLKFHRNSRALQQVRYRNLTNRVTDDFSDEAAFVMRKKPWSPRPRLTVLYDGGCGMCSAEINHYKRLQKLLQEKTIDFHDLSLGNHEETLRRGISTETLLERMHVIDENGKVFRNAAAFQEIWKRSPYWRYALYPLTTIPGVMPCAEFAYSRFVQFRKANNRRSASKS